MNGAPPRRSGGRPTAKAAAKLETTMLDAATAAFLAQGYAATTIEGVARAGGVSKRTLYARWSGKPALFRAVVERLMGRWLSVADDWVEADDLETALNEAASRILAVALTPEAVALHRLLIAESARFPELPLMMREAGADAGSVRIAVLLDRAVAGGVLAAQDTALAAEQFLHLVLAGPQRRALGLGRSLDDQHIQAWGQAAVALFLSGVRT
ncbi:MAG TPA: TetR/AcrR family transcriptional regulator [Rhodopila sp.]|jgi:AcrR family transcriptional regulator